MHPHITFFNHFHNGDIHVSRNFVRLIVNYIHQRDSNITFSYAQKNANVLLDIPKVIYNPNALALVSSEHDNLFVRNGSLFINTWYAQQHFKYMNRYGITMDSLYAAFDDSCKSALGFSLKDISSDPTVFFPSIDYRAFEIQRAQTWLHNHPGKKIFVVNGYALSGQSHNFPITPLVSNLARKHTDKIFILSNTDGNVNLPNVFQSSEIIGKSGCDLNENAFISESCDVIIGRPTGPFAFAQTCNNMINRKCKILCLSNLVPPSNGKFWLSDLLRDQIQYSAEIVVSNESNVITVQNMMDNTIS